MTAVKSWLREQGVGRLVYRWVHRPKQQLDLARRYGWLLAWRSAGGDRAMRRAVADLPPLPRAAGVFDRPIAFLTGRNFFHQALFCAHSLSHFAQAECGFEFITDGSLAADHIAALRRIFPRAVIPAAEELDARVRAALPPEKFPVLHAVRKGFVMLRKLTDAMAGQQGYRMVFDSDMLFWARPIEMLERASERQPLYMADMVDDGYTVSRAEIQRHLGSSAAKGVNGGLVALEANRIDWELMERACALLWSSAGDRRLVEQTLWAIALGDQQATALDPVSYRLLIDPDAWSRVCGKVPPPSLLHYAWHARLPYAATEWRRYLTVVSA